MNPILITGISGFLGRSLAFKMSQYFKVYSTYFSNPASDSHFYKAFFLNITRKDDVINLVKKIKPNFIIHCAAKLNERYCVQDNETAWEVNVKGTENIALAANLVNARLIYISSDQVFHGNNSLYSEEDTPNPICCYGKTKYEGEKIVSSISSNYCIARSSLIYGLSLNSSESFTEIIINDLKRGKKVKLFTDEYRSPVYIKNLCDILTELTAREDLQGLFHVCGSQRLSRFELGLRLSELFIFDRKLIIPVSVDDSQFKDERPKDCSMINEKLKKEIKTRIITIDEGLGDMASDWLLKKARNADEDYIE